MTEVTIRQSRNRGTGAGIAIIILIVVFCSRWGIGIGQFQNQLDEESRQRERAARALQTDYSRILREKDNPAEKFLKSLPKSLPAPGGEPPADTQLNDLPK